MAACRLSESGARAEAGAAVGSRPHARIEAMPAAPSRQHRPLKRSSRRWAPSSAAGPCLLYTVIHSCSSRGPRSSVTWPCRGTPIRASAPCLQLRVRRWKQGRPACEQTPERRMLLCRCQICFLSAAAMGACHAGGQTSIHRSCSLYLEDRHRFPKAARQTCNGPHIAGSKASSDQIWL